MERQNKTFSEHCYRGDSFDIPAWPAAKTAQERTAVWDELDTNEEVIVLLGPESIHPKVHVRSWVMRPWLLCQLMQLL